MTGDRGRSEVPTVSSANPSAAPSVVLIPPSDAVSRPDACGPQAAPDTSAATFVWHPDSDGWSWSPGLYRLLGYGHRAPRDRPAPGWQLLLAHQHDRDRGRTEQALRRICKDGESFVFEHRMHTEAGAEVLVILTVRRTGVSPVEVSGTLIDVTDSRRIYYAADGDTVVSLQAELARLTVLSDAREVIGRASGVLVERHKIPGEQAVELLRQAAQQSARKLVEVASELLYTGELPVPPLGRGHRTGVQPQG